MTPLRQFLNGPAFMAQCQGLKIVPVHLSSGWIIVCKKVPSYFHRQPLLGARLLLNPDTGNYYVTVFSKVYANTALFLKILIEVIIILL